MTGDHRDGNVLVGPLGEVFAFEVSTSLASCAGCGARGRIAELHVYDGGPGYVARCPHCASVVLRYAETPHGRFVDLRGVSVLHVPAS